MFVPQLVYKRDVFRPLTEGEDLKPTSNIKPHQTNANKFRIHIFQFCGNIKPNFFRNEFDSQRDGAEALHILGTLSANVLDASLRTDFDGKFLAVMEANYDEEYVNYLMTWKV